MELTCIVCPVGCPLVVEESAASDGNASRALKVTGNRCPRGAVYAQEEISSPKRTVTATCVAVIGNDAARHSPYAPRRVPVKTSVPCPKENIQELLHDIYAQEVTLPVKHGDIVISNWHGLGIDLVATRSIGLVQ